MRKQKNKKGVTIIIIVIIGCLLIMYQSCRSLPLPARLNRDFLPLRLPHFDRSYCPFASDTLGAGCSWRRASATVAVAVGGVAFGVGVGVVGGAVVVVVAAAAVVVVVRSGNGYLDPWGTPKMGGGGGRVPWRRRPERRVGNASGIGKGSCAVARWSRRGKVDVS